MKNPNVKTVKLLKTKNYFILIIIVDFVTLQNNFENKQPKADITTKTQPIVPFKMKLLFILNKNYLEICGYISKMSKLWLL